MKIRPEKLLPLLSALFAVLLCFGCAQTPLYALRTIRVPARTGMNDGVLGQPVDENFKTIVGEDGNSIFPDAKVYEIPTSEVRHEVVVFQDSAELKANLSVWNIAGVGVDSAKDDRFASVLAYHPTRVGGRTGQCFLWGFFQNMYSLQAR